MSQEHQQQHFKKRLSQATRIRQKIIALFLIFGMIFGLLMPVLMMQTAQAGEQSASTAVVLREGQAAGSVSLPLSRTEQSLLNTLKQIYPDFTTIQMEELTKFKGNVVIIPVFDETPEPFLNLVSSYAASGKRLIILPMLMHGNPAMDSFLNRLGFRTEGSQYLTSSLRLKSKDGGGDWQTYLPVGSMVFKISSNQPALSTWGDSIPAAVISKNVMLVNWNWNAGMPEEVLMDFIAELNNQSSVTIATDTPSTTGDVDKLLDSLTAKPKSIQVQKQPTGETPRFATQPGKPAPGKELTFTAPGLSVDLGNATIPQAAIQQAAVPRTIVPRTRPQASGESFKESYPEDLYEFDGAQGLSSGRNVATQNAMAEYYNDRMRELSDLQDKVNLLAAQSLNNTQRHNNLKRALEQSNQAKSKFESAWFQHNLGIALDAYEQSKEVLMKAMFDQVPTTQIEGRAIWLDRGSIVEAGSPDRLRQLIRRIAASGFNTIYFETINAGYPIYPSRIIEQNPLTRGWDPLEVAVDEAHKQGVELHAWVWVFAVGNIRHNKILGQPNAFPGPILSRPDMATEALKGKQGELVLSGQHEYWLSPASTKARNFLISYFSEIVSNYDVDGLQLDYIRYPFQKPNEPMGLEMVSANRFMLETGLNLDQPSEYLNKAWAAWKAFQVTTFVKDLTYQTKRIKPDLKISAAVFPIARNKRMSMIQQDWETWVRNGWVETLSPMAYSRSARSLQRLVQYVHNISEDKTLVYPGLSLQKLNAVELLDTLEIARQTGVMGTTLFAVTQFDNDKQLLLQTGPYKRKKTIPPHRDPLGASSQLLTETRSMVESVLNSHNSIPSLENLKLIHTSLLTLNRAMDDLGQRGSQSIESNYLLNVLRDDARVLKQQAEQWEEATQSDSIIGFQSKTIRQMVDKVVRMINYATYQIANHSTSSKVSQQAKVSSVDAAQ